LFFVFEKVELDTPTFLKFGNLTFFTILKKSKRYKVLQKNQKNIRHLPNLSLRFVHIFLTNTKRFFDSLNYYGMVPVPFKRKIEELFLVFILILYSLTSMKSIREHLCSEYGQNRRSHSQKNKN
jgi:hypothetical protein